MYFLGIDIGTTAIKVGIFDEEGNNISSATGEYLFDISSDKIKIETSQDSYWNIIAKAIRKSLQSFKKKEIRQIKSLSISTHTDTIFSLDKKGRDVRPVIVWLDGRGEEELKKITSKFNSKAMFEVTGQPQPSPMVFGNRIYWIKENEPENFDKVYKFMQVMDFVLYKLTGRVVGEATVYDGSYIYNINKNDYFDPILDFVGVGREKLPEIVKCGTNLGKIKKEEAEELGLPAGIQVIVGAMDQNCSSIGAGNFMKGLISETTGTVLALLTNIDKPIIDHDTLIPIYNQIISDMYCLLPWTTSGGLVLKWYKDTFYSYEEEELRNIKVDIYDYMGRYAEKVNPGSDDLITLPFFSGVHAPYNNPNARGVFFGLNLGHKKEHFTRSIMESTACMLCLYIELFRKMGIEVEEIISMGGGSKSSLWNQIKADLTGIPIKTLVTSEASVLGAAIIAAVGVGFYSTYEKACRKMVKIKDTYLPNLNNKEVYEKIYEKFLKLYHNNKDLFITDGQ